MSVMMQGRERLKPQKLTKGALGCIAGNLSFKVQDISFSPQTSRCLWARYAPAVAIQNSQKQIINNMMKRIRIIAFQRHETGLVEVKMIRRHRS